ncbi:hypothetical protein MRX96_024609 [Rhipicephalus microplus]
MKECRTVRRIQRSVSRFRGCQPQLPVLNFQDPPGQPIVLNVLGYKLLSSQKRLCQRTATNVLFSTKHLRALISTDEQLTSTDFVAQVKEKLDNLVSTDDWDCEEVIRQHGGDVTEVTDCIIYYVTGFICRKMRKITTCAACLSAFNVKNNTSTAAALTNAKTRGGLTHPTVGIFNLFKHAERPFVDYADWNTVYWDTIDGVLDTHTLTFPCSEHKEEVIAQLLHYYVSMRMRQHCQHVNGALKKQSQEKKKLAKLYSS